MLHEKKTKNVGWILIMFFYIFCFLLCRWSDLPGVCMRNDDIVVDNVPLKVSIEFSLIMSRKHFCRILCSLLLNDCGHWHDEQLAGD